MKKKFKGQVYRDAIEKLGVTTYFSCNTLDDLNYKNRYCLLFTGGKSDFWHFDQKSPGVIGLGYGEYKSTTELGRRTREIALELAAHLEDIGEMDKILGEK